MIAKVHINKNRLAFPLPSARGMLPMLSLGFSVGSSTLMSSSSCAGGRPDRRHMLLLSALKLLSGFKQVHLLFIQNVSNPEDPFSLFELDRVEIETRSSLMKSYAVRKA